MLPNVCFLRIAAVGADRSERRLSALRVEMCMVQQSDRSQIHHCHSRPTADLNHRLMRCSAASLERPFDTCCSILTDKTTVIHPDQVRCVAALRTGHWCGARHWTRMKFCRAKNFSPLETLSATPHNLVNN
jgi:hypothetical protein